MEFMVKRINDLLVRDNCSVDDISEETGSRTLGVVNENGEQFFITIEPA